MSKEINEEIIKVLVEACECKIEDFGNIKPTSVINTVCYDLFSHNWHKLIQFSVSNMTMEQFMKIKELSLGEDYPAYASKYRFCKCENK